MEVYEKLFNVQQKLKAPKTQLNKFGNYNYRSCEDILEAVKPHLKENKAVIVLSDAIESIGDKIYVRADATFIDIENGNSVKNSAYAREEDTKKGMDASQITGTSSSYARKYALNGLLAIDDVKDSDATNKHGKEDATFEPTATDILQEALNYKSKNSDRTLSEYSNEEIGELKVWASSKNIKKIVQYCEAIQDYRNESAPF